MDIISDILSKLVSILKNPESLVLLLWLATEKLTQIKRDGDVRDEHEKKDIVIAKLLRAQQERSETLTRISTMLETIIRRPQQ